MVKKKILLFIFGLLLISSLSGVFASDIGYYLNEGVRQIEPVARFFLGSGDLAYSGDYMLFERILLFFLVFCITFVALSKTSFFEGQKNVVVVLSLAVPLLAVRYIDFMWLNTILVSYKVFGIAVTSIIPFILYLFFLHGISEGRSSIVRKIGWILFICVYLGLYFTSNDSYYGEIYIWTGILAGVFLLLDGTISRALTMQKIKASGSNTIWDAIRKLQEEKNNYLTRAYGIPDDVKERRVRQLEKQIEKLTKQVA